MRFYENIFDKTKQVSVGVALKEAQNWLQNLTVKEFEENLAKSKFQQALNHLRQTLSAGDFFELEDAIFNTQNKLKEMSPEDKPFSHPFYWAAFIATGV